MLQAKLNQKRRESARFRVVASLWGAGKKRVPTKPKPKPVRDRLIEVASPEAVDSYLEFMKGAKARGTSD